MSFPLNEYQMETKTFFMIFVVFSVLLFSLVLMKRTYIAQVLGPAIPEPFLEKMEDMHMWIKPY
jgi:hypothetical protein